MRNKCTNVRVSLGLESRRYYGKQLTTELSAKERKKMCRTYCMGCLICKKKSAGKRGTIDMHNFTLETKCLINYPTNYATQSPAVTWQPMVQFE
jgi:hypothetical protein